LFSFDVHDDVRMLHDATKERDEVSIPERATQADANSSTSGNVQSHAGKVVERSWYQRSKHIFPASRWEVYDPDKDYGAYVSEEPNLSCIGVLQSRNSLSSPTAENWGILRGLLYNPAALYCYLSHRADCMHGSSTTTCCPLLGEGWILR
jgi:hypothetical protein